MRKLARRSLAIVLLAMMTLGVSSSAYAASAYAVESTTPTASSTSSMESAQTDAAGSSVPSSSEMSAQSTASAPSALASSAASASRSHALADGLYVISSAISPNMVIDVAGGSSANGANIQLWESNNSAAQKFWVEWDERGFYSMRALVSRKAIDLDGGKSASGTNIHQWDAVVDNPNQQWVIRESPVRLSANAGASSLQAGSSGSGACWTIVSRSTGLVLDVDSARAVNGANIQAYEANDSIAQAFCFSEADPLSEGIFEVHSAQAPNLVADVASGSSAEGANIQLYSSNGSRAQIFRFVHVNASTYAIQNVNSGRYIAAQQNGNVAAGAQGPAIQPGAALPVDTVAPTLDPAHLWRAQGHRFAFSLVNLATDTAWNADVPNGYCDGVNLLLATAPAKGPSAPDTQLYTLRAASLVITVGELQASLATAPGDALIRPFGTYAPSQAVCDRLANAIGQVNRRGYSLGFMMVDVKTGRGITYNADGVFYSASTLKGPYVASLAAKNPASLRSLGTMSNTIRESSNSDYMRLRMAYGSQTMVEWCQEAGINPALGAARYTRLTVRELCKLWMRNYEFFTSGDGNSGIRDLYTTPNQSVIKPTVGSVFTTWSKAGWYYEGNSQATADAGVVLANDHPYVVTIMSNVPSNFNMLREVMWGIEDAHNEMVR